MQKIKLRTEESGKKLSAAYAPPKWSETAEEEEYDMDFKIIWLLVKMLKKYPLYVGYRNSTIRFMSGLKFIMMSHYYERITYGALLLTFYRLTGTLSSSR